MIGALIGAGLSAVSSVVGGLAARKKEREASALLNNQLRENQAWWNNIKFGDGLKRGSALAMIANNAEHWRREKQDAKGTNAVMGIGNEEVIAEAGNKSRADLNRQLIHENERYTQQAEQQYLNTKAALKGQQYAALGQEANNIANTVKSVGAVAGHIANGLDSVQDKAQKAGDVASNEPPVDTGKALEDQLMKRYGGGDLFNRNGGASV